MDIVKFIRAVSSFGKNVIDVAFRNFQKNGRGFFVFEFKNEDEYNHALQNAQKLRIQLNYETDLKNYSSANQLDKCTHEYDPGHQCVILIITHESLGDLSHVRFAVGILSEPSNDE